MRIIYNNLIDSLEASAVSVYSETAPYVVTNVQDERLTKKWRSDDTSNQTVIFDLGATTSTTIFAILSHNISASAVTTIVGNDEIGSSMTWMVTGQSTVQTITYNSGIMLNFSSLTNRYYKFEISGQSTYTEIGRLWIGNYIDINPSSLLDFKVIKKRNDVVVYGKNRQKYGSPGNGWRRFEFSFPRTEGTTLSAIQTLYDTVGNYSSIIFCNFDTIRDYDIVEPCYCSIDGELEFTHTERMRYEYNLNLEEDL